MNHDREQTLVSLWKSLDEPGRQIAYAIVLLIIHQRRQRVWVFEDIPQKVRIIG